jgi:hypothetical protein
MLEQITKGIVSQILFVHNSAIGSVEHLKIMYKQIYTNIMTLYKFIFINLNTLTENRNLISGNIILRDLISLFVLIRNVLNIIRGYHKSTIEFINTIQSNLNHINNTGILKRFSYRKLQQDVNENRFFKCIELIRILEIDIVEIIKTGKSYSSLLSKNETI